MLKKYKFSFDILALVLFLLIMLPNFLWFAIPAPNDVLRAESVTPIVDAVGPIFQIIMIAALCFVVRKKKAEFALWQKVLVVACVCLYYAGWTGYYCGIANAAVILDLCVAPCLAFLLFATVRKNIFGFVAGVVFTVCHIWFALKNFIS